MREILNNYRKRTISLILFILVILTLTIIGTPSKEELVRVRGERVMQFDLKSSQHFFLEDENEFKIIVISKDINKSENIRNIKYHLRELFDALKRGDFSMPKEIHGENMPGIEKLSRNYKDLNIEFRELPYGAEITLKSNNKEVTRSLKIWFNAQLRDHGSDAKSNISEELHKKHHIEEATPV